MFRNILIPVDFEINTEMAIKKAIELSDEREATINLFHVQRNSFFSKLNHRTTNGFNNDWEIGPLNVSEEMLKWKELIQTNYPDLKVKADIKKAPSIQNAIISKGKAIEADLIIICKHSYNKLFTFLNTVFPNRIAKMTGAPVLTFMPGSFYTKTKCIVVPIGPTIPKRKIDMLVAFKQKFRISIHLVTVLKEKQNSNEFSAYALMQTYKFLKDIVQCPLHHEVLHGNNVAAAAFNYAKSIKADMLLVEPELETQLSTFPKKHINDELKPNSKLQILAVHS
ncbi:MAG TPA: universal stress protein [Chitinophagaceae bacterium]